VLNNSNKHYSLDDNILYFLHIPKTAGTTFTFNLDSYYDVQNIYPERVLSGFFKNPPSNFLSLKLIRGHFGYDISKFLQKTPLFLTFLRNPIERTLSFFDHIKLDPYTNNWVNQNFILNETISDLLVDKSKSKIFTNNQTRHIANDLDYTKLNNSNNFLLEEYEPFVNPTLTDEQLITLAKKRLSEFAFIGLTEKTTESLLLFCYTFNLKPLGNFWNLMVAPKRTSLISLDIDTKNNLKKCNNLDLQLYEFGQELFNFRFSRMLDDLRNFSDFDLNNNKLFQSKLYDFLDFNHKTYLKNQCSKLSTIDYDFSGRFNGNGWHYRELHSNPPNYFRWTGPSKNSTIDFILLPNIDYDLELSILDSISEEQLNSFQCFVNDNLIDLKIIFSNNLTIFTGMIPKSIICDKDVTRFTFRISKTLEINSSTLALSDSRMCGLAFDNIKIHPKK
jgi:hypothetical protein